jgi:hypothetical protein
VCAFYSCDKNINELAYNEKCIVYKFDGEYREYSSDIPINPTYKDSLIIQPGGVK